MRVVQIIDILYYGGAQTMQVMLAKEFAKRSDVELTIVSLRENTHNSPIPEQLEDFGAEVFFLSARKLFNIPRFWKLIQFLKQGNFDVVHTHLPYANILGTIAGRLARIPVVASIRNTRDDDWGRYYLLRHKIETLVLRYLSNQVMAVGHKTADIHQDRLGKKRIFGVPNAIEIFPNLEKEIRVRVRSEFINSPSQILIISVGRLVPQKGYSDLIAAFQRVNNKHPESFLLIAGDGPLHSELAEQIKWLRLEGHVRLLGSRNDVPKLLDASDIYVSSSHWEGLSVAILEAMAAGLPVIATEVGDTPKVVVPGVGLLIPPSDIDRLAEVMNFLIENPDERKKLSQGARQFIQENHHPSDWADQILALYNL